MFSSFAKHLVLAQSVYAMCKGDAKVCKALSAYQGLFLIQHHAAATEKVAAASHEEPTKWHNASELGIGLGGLFADAIDNVVNFSIAAGDEIQREIQKAVDGINESLNEIEGHIRIKTGEAIIGDIEPPVGLSRSHGVMQTQDVPQAVASLFQHALYGANHFVDSPSRSASDDSQEGVAICTGSKNTKSPLTILTMMSHISPEEYVGMLHGNRIKHAQLHGLSYCAYSHPLGEHFHVNRVVSKLSAIRTLFSLGHSAIVWMDADAVIMNHRTDFLDVVGEHASKDVIWSTDFNEPRGRAEETSKINSGVFIMKDTPFSSRLLQHCIQYQLLNSTEGEPNPDQTAIADFRGKHEGDFNSHVVILPWNNFNSWAAYYQAGDFVVHMARSDKTTGKYKRLLDSYMIGSDCCS